MISCDTYQIAGLNLNLIVAIWLVIEHAQNIVSVLPTVVVDVVQRFKSVVRIWVECLHNLKKKSFIVLLFVDHGVLTSYATRHTCELKVQTRKSDFESKSISSIIPLSDESV